MFKSSIQALLSIGDENFCVHLGKSGVFEVYMDNDDVWMISNRTRIGFLGSRETMCRFVLEQNPRLIFQEDEVLWSAIDTKAVILQTSWRKYRLRTTRDRNDLTLRGLAEYFGHPRFQDFSV